MVRKNYFKSEILRPHIDIHNFLHKSFLASFKHDLAIFFSYQRKVKIILTVIWYIDNKVCSEFPGKNRSTFCSEKIIYFFIFPENSNHFLWLEMNVFRFPQEHVWQFTANNCSLVKNCSLVSSKWRMLLVM